MANRGTCGKRMTMKEWEASATDKKLDKAGTHGHSPKETPADKAADKRDLAAHNRKVCK